VANASAVPASWTLTHQLHTAQQSIEHIIHRVNPLLVSYNSRVGETRKLLKECPQHVRRHSHISSTRRNRASEEVRWLLFTIQIIFLFPIQIGSKQNRQPPNRKLIGMMIMNYHLALLLIVSVCKLHVCNSFLGYKWSRYSFSNPIFKLEASNNAAFKHVEKISKDALINPKILTDKPRELYVKRSLAPDQRLPFESFRLGQKCTGKIISIVK